ncbi:MAG: NAD-glutamate dehydrogenase domain-containing protein, partial [Pseudomonadota bacterium]
SVSTISNRSRIWRDKLTPNELIRAILVSDFDLLWNGGIGTYVKSRLESDLDVADKSNDAIRVNGADLRCRVIGEGGNLGMTQLGRVEFNLAEGVCFTDSIDNAGGVNCSDIEVNVKILLNQLVETGRLAASARNKLLNQMTDEVADIVLESNYEQAQTINLMVDQATKRSYEYVRVMQLLAQDGLLDRQLEFLPGEEDLQDRLTRNESLTGPELAILTSYVKGWLKESLMSADLDEPYVQAEALTAFPATLPRRFGDDIADHRLHKEIIATEIANSMVNLMGISFPSRIMETTGVTIEAMSCSFVAVRDIFELNDHFKRIQSLDFKIPPRLQKDMRLDLIRLVRRSTRWLLRHRPDDLTLTEAVTLHHSALMALLRDWEVIVTGEVGKASLVRHQELVDLGVDPALARIVSASHHLYALMGIVRISMNTGLSPTRVGQLLFRISEALNLNWFSLQIHDYQPATQWESLARESLQDDLYQRQVAITGAIAALSVKQGDDEAVESWTTAHQEQIDRWLSVQAELRASPVSDLSIFTVGIRELSELAAS